MTEFPEFDEPFEPILVNGVDYRQRVIHDPGANYRQQVEKYGVMVTCEWCGKQWKTHAVNAARTHACGTNCRMKAMRRRSKGEMQRKLFPMPHRPWEHIGKKDA